MDQGCRGSKTESRLDDERESDPDVQHQQGSLELAEQEPEPERKVQPGVQPESPDLGVLDAFQIDHGEDLEVHGRGVQPELIPVLESQRMPPEQKVSHEQAESGLESGTPHHTLERERDTTHSTITEEDLRVSEENMADFRRQLHGRVQELTDMCRKATVSVDDEKTVLKTGQKVEKHHDWKFTHKWEPKPLRDKTHRREDGGGYDYDYTWPPTGNETDKLPSKTSCPWYPFMDAVEAAHVLMVYSGISKSDFGRYRTMARSPWYGREEDAPKIKKWEYYRSLVCHLPVMKMYIKKVYETDKENNVITREYGFHSLFDLLVRLLQYGENFKEMRFLPRVGDYISEMWHGRVCRDSPMFTSPTITVGGAVYTMGQYVRYSPKGDSTVYVGRLVSIFAAEGKEECLQGMTTPTGRSVDEVLEEACDRNPDLSCFVRRHTALPDGNSQFPRRAGHGRDLLSLWGKEDKLVGGEGLLGSVDVCSTPEAFQVKVAARAQPASESPNVYLCEWADVSECIGATGTSSEENQFVPVSSMPGHPTDLHTFDFSRLRTLPEGVPVLRLYLTFYYDMFAAYNKTYHKVGGLYIGLGNLPMFLQDQLVNILAYTLIPPKVSFEEATAVLFDQIRQLQKGVMLWLGPEIGHVFVQGTIALVRLDTQEGQDLSGHRSCTSNRPCRICRVPFQSLADCKYDVVRNGRTVQYQRFFRSAARKYIGDQGGLGPMDDQLKTVGLKLKTDMFTKNGVLASHLRVMPYDNFHAEVLGIAMLFLGRFVGALTKSALEVLAIETNLLDLPFAWKSKLLPVVATGEKDSLKLHRGKHVQRLIQVFPFLLRGWLKESSFTLKQQEKFKANLGKDWVKVLVATAVAIARSSREAFLDSRPSGLERARDLDAMMREGREMLVKAWPDTFEGRSNTHNALHMAAAHLDFCIKVISAARYETKHGQFRAVNTNHIQPELHMLKGHAVINSLSFYCGCYGHAHLKGTRLEPGSKLVEWLANDAFALATINRSQEARTYAEGGITRKDNMILQSQKLDPRPTRRELTTETAKALREAYATVYPKRALPEDMPTHVLDFEWVELAGRRSWRRRVVVGHGWTVNVEGLQTPMERENDPAIAIVGRIFGHTVETDGDLTIWVQLDWLKRSKNTDSLGCPKYKRQDGVLGSKWFRIFSPASLLTPVHLLHTCRQECGQGLSGTVGYKATNGDEDAVPKIKAQHVVKNGDTFVHNNLYQH